MSKFKAGDRIRRVDADAPWAPIGFETVVTQEGWYRDKGRNETALVEDQWELIVDTPKSKFEVGKQYHRKTLEGHSEVILTCLHLGEERAIFILRNERSFSEDLNNRVLYDEYVEPKTVELWVNVYPQTPSGSVHKSKTRADAVASPDRIACVKVIATEGTYDEK